MTETPSPGISSETQRAKHSLLLRFRAEPTFWQRLQAWLRQLWQRWYTPRLVIQPPLQPGRHKPFPNRPHHRRRQAVFAALATAPPDATIHALMAHVRALTGTGCSRKLIIAWRQTRGNERRAERDAAQERQSDTARRWRGVQLRLFLVCLLLGTTMKPWHPVASVAAQEITISPAPSASPTISNPLSPISPSPTPRLLRIKLTLHAPHELRIKQGDTVKAGDLLSDQRQARQRLLVQKRTLASVAHHLQIQRQLTAQSLQQLNSLGLDLPPTTFATEQAAITKAEAEAVAVNHAVEIQQQKVAVVGGWESEVGSQKSERGIQNLFLTDHRPPTTDHHSLITAHEAAKLTQAQDKQWLAHSEIELHKAKLTTAQETRAWEEQKHRVEITRQRLSVRQQQQQAAIERARLTANIAELDLQLAHLIEVRAPFTGTIKRIEWEDMNNETITVVVYLLVGSR